MNKIIENNEKAPLVSIIVPIYGVEKYLCECIESIICQTYSNIEIILVDDGSHDRCPQICDEFAQKDKRIAVIHKKNGGLVSARKAGASIAKGQYIQFVDGDDWIANVMTEQLVRYAIQYKVDLVASELYFAKDENSLEKYKNNINAGHYQHEYYRKEIIPRMLYSGKYFEFGIYASLCNKLFCREKILPYIQGVDDNITLGEDVAILFPYLLSIETIYILDESYYYYRCNNNSITRAYNPLQLDNTKILLDYLYSCFKTSSLECSSIFGQLDYYKLFITELNLINEAKIGFSKDVIKRWRNMKAFIKDMDIESILDKSTFSINAVRSERMLKIAISRWLYLLMFYQAIRHGGLRKKNIN